jgi:2',3'-cyclic-nucleotide 2'-phosphodiesterase (5'-nucleotidase family)
MGDFWRPAHELRAAFLGSLALCAAACASVPTGRIGDTVDLVIAGTTDTHGRLRGWDYYTSQTDQARSLTRLATVIDSVRAANPGRVILLDAGDILQGNPLAYFAAKISADKPTAIVGAMNAMGYDAAAIGNHEFNFGVPYLDSAIVQAQFPFLSDNTYRLDGAHAYLPWKILVRDGVRVGIIGTTTPGVMAWDASNIRGRLTLGDILPAVRQSVAEVKSAGADLVVVLAHSGLDEASSYDTVATGVPSENVAARIAREITGIDLILYGHSHKEMRELTIGPTLLVQPKNWAGSVSIVHMHLVRTAAGWSVARKTAELVQAANHAESPAILATTESVHQKTVAYFNAPIGSTTVAWRADSSRRKDTPIIDFVLEVERREAGADLAATASYIPGAALGPGPITMAQLAQLDPYSNTLRAVRISGKQLRDYLEFSSRYYTGGVTPSGEPETNPRIPGYNFDMVSGVDYTIDLNKPIGARVTRLEYKGRAVSDSDSFTMAVNNYRQAGGGGYSMLSGAPVVYDKELEIRQLLVDEVRRRGELRPADYFTPNWTLLLPAASPGR